MGGEAVFSDPRWSARAIALALQDLHRGGARSAADYARVLAVYCGADPTSPCTPDRLARMLAANGALGADLSLFDDRDRPNPALRRALVILAGYMRNTVPSNGLLGLALATVADNDLDQSERSFERWMDREPERRAKVEALERRLERAGVGEVAPVWQLLRTGTDWLGCGEPFDVPPPVVQEHIVLTLKVVREGVVRDVGPIEVMSTYREPWLNMCAGGAERSSHREFYAIDLVPLGALSRQELMERLCPIYIGVGQASTLGLNFYSGVRFHVDTNRHRSWASADGQTYAPCNPGGTVNLPPPPRPPARVDLPRAPPSR